MRKYDMRICKCGKIHMIPFEKIDKAIETNKNFLFICADCGAATVIGADEDWDEYDDEKCYMMYAGDFSPYKSKEITEEIFSGNEKEKAIPEIYYSYGLKVIMKNGYYATEYFCGKFKDTREIADLYKIDRPNVTAEEVQAFIKKTREDASTVNMNRFIRETPEEYLEEISGYYIKAFDWKGTKYYKGW